MSDDRPTVPTGDRVEAATRAEHGSARGKAPRAEPTPDAGARYQLEDEIARGGMGRVVEAIDRELDRRVAVKEALTTDLDSLLRFRREIWITARLEHPAIVPLYDAGTRSDGTPFYVMRKIGGRPLVELVEEAKAVEARLALVPHVLAAARAIAHAHGRRVVHRDLKPSNILVGELGETVVIDWGLAKLYGEVDQATGEVQAPVDGVTRVGTVMGTPGFMPPEQVAGGEADPRVDVYALGATLYYVLARRLPHAHDSTQELMAAVVNPATPIAKLAPEVPRDLAAIVDLAISPDREKRFADAGAMAAELERFLAGRLIASRRYTAWERLWRFVNRHRVAVITVVVAVLALAIGGALAFDRVLSARDEAVHEREVAQQLLETMTLDRARSLVEQNPTAAVALVRSLSTGPRWREARAVVAAAEAHGVASTMAGPEVVSQIVVAPTAPRGAALDNVGRLWTYDLDTHHSTDRGTYDAGDTRIEFFDDRTLLIAEPARTTLLDLVANTQRAFPYGGLPVISAGHVILHHKSSTLGELDVASGTLRPIGLFPRESGTLALSKDAEWILFRSKTSVMVLERATGNVIHDLPFGPAISKWDPDRSDRFVVAEVGRVTVVTFDRQAAQRREIEVDDFGPAALTRDRVCFAGRHNFGLIAPYSQLTQTPGGALPTVTIGAHGLCYMLGSTRVAVIGDVTPRELVSPIQISRVATAPGNPYVIAAGNERVVAWRVPDVARRLFASGNVPALPMGNGVLFGSTIDVEAQWHYIDPSTGIGKRVQLPADAYAVEPIAAEQGDVAAFRDLPNHRTIVAGLRSGKVTVLDYEAPLLAVGGRVVVGTADGVVRTVDDDGITREIFRGARQPDAAFVTPTCIALGWSDGRLWRITASGTLERKHDHPVRDLAITDDDEVYLLAGNSISVWQTDGTIAPVATASGVVDRLVYAKRDHVLIRMEGGVLARIERTGGERRLATGANMSISRATARVLVYRGADLELSELDAGTSWKIGVPPAPFTPTITNDGRWIVFAFEKALYALPIDLPETPEALAARIDLLTNGEVDRAAPSSVIRWRD